MIRASFCAPDEVRDILAPACGRKANSGRFTLDEMLAQGQCVKVVQGVDIVAAYVIKADGGELWVLLAAGRADFDLCPVLAALLEQHGQAFDSIGFTTERAGLVKKARREGYQIVRTVMRKKLK